jgi:hypothetical protein
MTPLAQRIATQILDPEVRTDKPIWHAGTLYLTDGRILVAMPNQEQPHDAWLLYGDHFSRTQDAKQYERINATSLFAIAKPAEFAPYLMPKIDGPPGDVDALWQSMQECGECSGFGWRECNMGHEHDCDNCDGDGKIMDECEEASQRTQVGDKAIKRRYAWIISQMPAVVIGNHPTTDAIAFRFSEGCGLVMVLK